MLNRKAQIGETTTWIVATLIIITILIVSFFISSAAEIVGGKSVLLLDKQKDFVITKSVTNVLIKDYDSLKDSLGDKDPIEFFNNYYSMHFYLSDDGDVTLGGSSNEE